MKGILGVKIGFLSNFMVWIHTFAAVVSVWLFSFNFLFHSIVRTLMNGNINPANMD